MGASDDARDQSAREQVDDCGDTPVDREGEPCVVEAEQLCLLLGEDRRGDERVVTQAFTGVFESSEQRRNEFLRAIG